MSAVVAPSTPTTTSAVPSMKPAPTLSPRPLSNGRVAWLIIGTIVAAVAAYYFIGIDEGMTSLFGRTMVVHEWVHDARHLLGFPCH